MKIYADIYRQILSAFPVAPPEGGGIMGSSEGEIITDVYFDLGETSIERAIYTPDISVLNCKIADWQKDGICFQGLMHSHPVHHNDLSQADKLYIQALMSEMPIGVTMYFPIVIPFKEIIPFAACNKTEGLMIQKETLKIIERSNVE